ncbi:hypothetical protein KC221_22780, partial [Mycobacterium tuberculosis]|nr:hypothetical protein [Mycobacterium tuberculosis]
MTVAVVLAIMFRTARVPGILTGETGGMLSVPAGARSAGNILFRWLAFALFCLPYLFLYAPLAIIAIFSFNDATVQVFPLRGMPYRCNRVILGNT